MPVLSIAGSGNAGAFLAIKLFESGYFIKQIYSRTKSNAISLAEKVNANGINEISEIDPNIDLLIIALPDNVIPGFCNQLNKVKKSDDLAIASVSGSVQLIEIEEYFKNAGVLYPVQSFTRMTNPDQRNIPVCIEATNTNTELLIKEVALLLSNDVRYIDSNQRIYLHMAAVFASNFTNHMIAIAQEILQKAGIENNILTPLIHETINRLDIHKASDMQTGPAIRNDVNTLKKHVDLLKKTGDQRLREIYELISANISSTAQKNVNE